MDIAAAQRVMLATHIAALRLNRRPSAIMLEGGPGIAKSESFFGYAEALARAYNKPVGLTIEMLATYTSPDIRGFMLPTKGNKGELDTVFSKPAWFPTTANIWVVEPNGTWHKPGAWTGEVPDVGVVCFDEFGQAEDEVKKPAAEILLNGRIGSRELEPGWRVIAAQNRMSDRSGVMRELMFIVNRRCRLSIDASLPAWLTWAQASGKPPPPTAPAWLMRPASQHELDEAGRLHYLTISFAQKNPDVVFKDSVPEGTDPFCTPRSLTLLDRDLMALRSEQDVSRDTLPTDSLAREVAAGWIGGGSAGQFFTHIKYAELLPDIEDIIKDPAKAKCPEGRDVQMVAAYMLAHHVEDASASPIMRYLGRLNVEMQVLAVKAANTEAKRAKALVSVPEYTQWLMKHKDLLIASQS